MNKCRKCGTWLMVNTARPTGSLTPRHCGDCPPLRYHGRDVVKRQLLPNGWTLDEHGNAIGPHGVRVWIDCNAMLNVKQTPKCGEPVPLAVVTLLQRRAILDRRLPTDDQACP